MHPFDRSSLRQGLLDDIGALKAVESEILSAQSRQAQAHVDLQEAEAVVKRAQALLRNAESQSQLAASAVQHLMTRRDTLMTSMTQARALLRTLATIPEDALSLIFHEACVARSPLLPGAGIVIDQDAVAMPYHIASVCRHWRSTALATPSLWTYIALPEHEWGKEHCELFQGHLDLVTRRSGVLPLDVVVLAGFRRPSVIQPGPAPKWQYRDLIDYFFGAMIGNAYRVRSLTISSGDQDGMLLPGLGFVRQAVVNLLRCPTPRLEELDVYVPEFESNQPSWLGYPAHAFPRILPEAPLLRRMRLQQIPIICCNASSSLPSLVSFDFTASHHSTAYGELLWDMFKLAPKLEHVQLDIERLDHVRLAASSTTQRDTLPIRSLHIREQDSHIILLGQHRFNMPHLSTLSIGSHLLIEIDATVLRSLGDTVNTLVLFLKGFPEGSEDVLRQFRSVETLKIEGHGEFSLDSDDGNAGDLVFDELCSFEEPVMWPRLRSVVLHQRCARGFENDGLLRLLCARNLRDGVAEGGTAAPCPVERVEFDTFSVPAWVAVNIRSMLGDKCTITDKKYYAL
ncbi:hypothetical protein AURDEDRAFT_184515 [Auricularia subglabra TFB-10046 SS5]|nr:hypothetical protein AURDEDRAFT_184515 [Auricularia subglabra TFB-10046 SS5]